MARAPGLFDVDARLRELSAKGDDLERVNALVDFEAFRPELEQAVPRADRAKGGRPPYDHVLMFRILILQASHSLSDERTEYLVKDRLSFMRFLGLSLADRVPDANSIWNFREALTRAVIGGVPAIEALFRRFEAQLSAAGYIAMGGQIVDATVVAAPKQGSVLNFVYLARSMRFQILKRRSARRTLWRTGCGPQTIPGRFGRLSRSCGWPGRSALSPPRLSGMTLGS